MHDKAMGKTRRDSNGGVGLGRSAIVFVFLICVFLIIPGVQ